MAARRQHGGGSLNSMVWLMVSVCLGTIATRVSAESCPPCGSAEGFLKMCNTTLGIEHWPGTFTYQPTQLQTRCACNQNFYNLMADCVRCQTSTTAKLTIQPIENYKSICVSLGEATFPSFYTPLTTTTTTTTAPTDLVSPTDSGTISAGPGHSNGLSSGAIAGIIVSAVALIVALSVAGYVFTRRRREIARQEEERYKYEEGSRNSYMDSPLPQYTGMIQPSLPALPQITNLRVMNPDNDVDDYGHGGAGGNNGTWSNGEGNPDAPRNSYPGWRRGSFDDD